MSNPFTEKDGKRKRPTIGDSAEKSRQQAESARKRTEGQRDTRESVDSEAWPRGVDGQPMIKISMTAAELLPTGQFANVSIGPAQITAFVDERRALEDEESYFNDDERDTLAKALNELAEIVEADVIVVQRNLVQESIQDQVTSGSN